MHSMIEIFLIISCVSVCFLFISSNNHFLISVLRFERFESELVLINYLNFTDSLFNESFALLIASQCSNASFFMQDGWFFNESKRAIIDLNNNNSFILLINSTSDYMVFNDKPWVILDKAMLSFINLSSPCGDLGITYGSWSD